MKLQEALTFAKKYSSAVFLNRIFPLMARDVVIVFSCIIFVTTTGILTILYLGSLYDIFPKEYLSFLMALDRYQALFLFTDVLAALLLAVVYPLHSYARYYMLNSVKRVFGTHDNRFRVSYEAAEALLIGEKSGFVKGLLSVRSSFFILRRLRVTMEEIAEYNVHIDMDQTVPEYNDTITLGSLWKMVYENSDDLRKFFLSKKVQKEIFYDTCDWLDRTIEETTRGRAWWWRENLSRKRGIGKTLSYGGTGFISKYARELVVSGGTEDVGKVLLHKNSLIALEEALSKKQGGNAVIVGSRGTGRHTIIKILSRMIDQGNCYAEIEHKRVFEFDNTILGSLDAHSLVEVFARCFDQALIARNIIFVINDMPTLFEMIQKKGIDFFQILERYSNQVNISLVCVCDQPFYQNEAHKAIFDKSFDVIHIEEMNNKLLTPYIQDLAMIIEQKTGTFFPSYSVSVVTAALGKYFVEESPLVKAEELLYSIATSRATGDAVILDEDSVASALKTLTGVSTGIIQDDEKEKLLTLEATLHKKVIGQSEALKVVASTMRRSRAGLVGNNKPIGSFLFLGPTGVGKTETAKILAEVFFNSEDSMSRIDMNEYTMGNSSQRLLGDANEEGDIARLIHGRPYGVLLLDEFEKATTDVKDIFLRVLDEGVFTNGAGKLISARTQIIVATSNAGSEYIRESGLHPDSTKEEIEIIKNKLLNTIISEGLFRPELINRFDAVVMFHPLGDDSRIQVAKKMLDALRKRLLSQGYEVTFTDALVQKVLGGEGDASFGGRSIQRNIQTDVEEALARKIIEGSLQVGSAIVLDAVDIE